MNTKITSVLACLLSIGLAHSLMASDKVNQQIAERTKPVGEVCVEGDPCASAVSSAAASSGPRAAADIYQASCNACHATGAAGAPLFGDVGQWESRIAKGMDTLYSNSIAGFNGMPPKGLCMDCSDDELKAVVDYMVESAQ